MRYTDPQYRRYAPNEYRSAEEVTGAAGFGAILAVVGFASGFEPLCYFGLFILVAGGIFAAVEWWSTDTVVKRGIEADQAEDKAMEERIVSDISKLKTLGNTVIANGGSIVQIGDHNTANYLNNLAKNDPDLDNALKVITGAVENSGKAEAGESWKDFLDELSGSKKKSKLANAWNGVLRVLPDIATFTESVAKVTSIFA